MHLSCEHSEGNVFIGASFYLFRFFLVLVRTKLITFIGNAYINFHSCPLRENDRYEIFVLYLEEI